MERPAAESEPPAPAATIAARLPAFELMVAFLFSIVPHVAGLVAGGYGQIITNAPLAVIVTIIDGAALVIACLQLRDDTHARRASHGLVWATIALGAIWMIYAVFVGGLLVFGRIFCINEDCRAPIR